jgi:hypothetical protein
VNRRYTPEQIQWVRDNCQGLSPATLMLAFNSHFKTGLSEMQIRGILYNNKIKTKAKRRAVHYPVGIISKNGKEIKIGDNEWQTVRRFLQLKELKKALKVRLKEVDKKLYNIRYGNKGKRIKNMDLIKNLMRDGNGCIN